MRIPLAGEHLNQLFLTIAGYTRDADDLARMNVEAYVENYGRAAVADHVQPVQFQIGGGMPRCFLGRGARFLRRQRLAEHQRCQTRF